MKLLVGLALAGLLVLCLTSLYLLKGSMYKDRSSQTEQVVRLGMGVLDHFHKLATAGRMTDEEARKAAKEALRSLRYSNNDYFFIFSTDHAYVLNPPKPEVEGQNKADMQDSNGKYLVRELVSAAKRGGGSVEYWFPRAGQTKPEPKLSYAALFGPWEWVIGTGVYIDDIETEYWRVARILGGISLLILAAFAAIGWQTGRSILGQLGGEPTVAGAAMKDIAQGNLVTRIDAAHQDSLLASLKGMADSLRQLVKEINAEANSLVDSAGEITAASSSVSRAAEQQSEATSAIAAAIEELTVSSNHILDSAKDTEGDSQEAMSLAVQGCERVAHASDAIQEIARTVTDASGRIRTLESRATEISSIASVIKDIAGQTNLLALNAAIEAARAGEQGRGFAVVADEVRQLAERTAAATTEIEQMIAAIQIDTGGAVTAMNQALPEVQRGVELAESAMQSLRAIESGAKTTLDRVRDVANATREQSAASTSIAQRIEQIARMVDETSVTIRGNAETARSLESVARNLKTQIARFVV